MIDMLEALIKHAMPDIADEGMIRCLGRRGIHFEQDLTLYEEIANLKFVFDAWDTALRETLDKEVASAKKNRSDYKEYIEDLVKHKAPLPNLEK